MPSLETRDGGLCMTTTSSFSRLGGGGLLPSLEAQDGSGLSTHLTDGGLRSHPLSLHHPKHRTENSCVGFRWVLHPWITPQISISYGPPDLSHLPLFPDARPNLRSNLPSYYIINSIAFLVKWSLYQKLASSSRFYESRGDSVQSTGSAGASILSLLHSFWVAFFPPVTSVKIPALLSDVILYMV
jgi:hypothetical protein